MGDVCGVYDVVCVVLCCVESYCVEVVLCCVEVCCVVCGVVCGVVSVFLLSVRAGGVLFKTRTQYQGVLGRWRLGGRM